MANRRGSRIIPLTLGIAMLAVVLVAGLFPNAGTVQAQASCPYGGCSTPSSVPVWEYVSIIVLIAVAAIVALLFIMRRRRPPSATTTPAAGAAAGGLTPWAAGPSAPSEPAAPYIETPEDVGHPPPSVGGPSAAPAAAAAGAAAGAEPASDIDSLMAELDKISTEILKKSPKRGAAGKGGETAEAEDMDKPS